MTIRRGDVFRHEAAGAGGWGDPLGLCDDRARGRFIASSDATNIETRIRRDGGDYVIQGRKWWTSGALDPRCKIMIVMGQSDPDNPDRYRRQSMIRVPLPYPGVVVKRMLPAFGYDEAPHGHAEGMFDNV